jgi:hypothetical protein
MMTTVEPVMATVNAVKPRRGRPRKFLTASRAITLTLPEHVIARLGAVDPDLGRAVVRLAQSKGGRPSYSPAELTTFGRRAVIVVNPSKVLEERTGIVLVPLSDGRALISFDESMTVAGLELSLQDALDDSRLSPADAEIFRSIAGLLKGVRLSSDVMLRQRTIIVLESRTRRRRVRSASASTRRR